MTRGQRQRQVELIWGAMLSTVPIYGVVCAVAVGTADAGAEADAALLRYALSTIAVVLGGLSAWWRRHFLATEPAPPAPLSFAQMQSHGVVVWALSEAVGICGVVAAVVLHEAREYIPFGAAAAALLLLHRPSNLPWVRLASPEP